MSGSPLRGRSVVVTRAAEQAGELVGLIEELGGSAIHAPTIRFVEPSDSGRALSQFVEALGSGARRPDWIVFTSANAVRRFLAREAFPDGAAAALHGVSVAAVGPATRDALAEHRIEADLVPRRFVAEGLLEEFPDAGPGATVWLPRAEVAREVLPEGLRERGWQVEVIPTYRTVPATPDETVRGQVAGADAVIFASGSAVEAFVEIYGPGVPPVVAVIGPASAERARGLGLEVDVQPEDHTLEATVQALGRYFATRG